MVHPTAALMAAATFTIGLLLGLVLHLPGAHSPPYGAAHHRHKLTRRNLPDLHDKNEPSQHLQLKRDSPQLDEILLDDISSKEEILLDDTLERVSQAEDTPSRLIKGETYSRSHAPQGNEPLSDIGHLRRTSDILSVVQETKRSVIRTLTIAHKNNNATANARGQTVIVNVYSPNAAETNNNDIPRNDLGNSIEDFRKEDLALIKEGNVNASSGIFQRVDGSDLGSIVEGIYWTPAAESLVTGRFTADDASQWREKLRSSKITGMVQGCGRMQNRQLVLSDGTLACARYRQNTDQAQGEVYSFYLSRILGINHVPPTALELPHPDQDRWRPVNKGIKDAQWAPNKVTIVAPWVPDLQPSYIPEEFRQDDVTRRLQPTGDILAGKSQSDIRELVQWSDLIVFDYLTANLDRVVNNMYNQQWNPDMMLSPAHNLEQRSGTGFLVFLDNESGLFHSYRLLDKYEKYHRTLLNSLCLFRRNTANIVKNMAASGNIGREIMDLFQAEEPELYRHLPKLPERTLVTLQQRLREVRLQIARCEALFAR